jgi:hypothetical protein
MKKLVYWLHNRENNSVLLDLYKTFISVICLPILYPYLIVTKGPAACRLVYEFFCDLGSILNSIIKAIFTKEVIAGIPLLIGCIFATLFFMNVGFIAFILCMILLVLLHIAFK